MSGPKRGIGAMKQTSVASWPQAPLHVVRGKDENEMKMR